MNLQKILEDIRKQNIAPIYLALGSDRYLADLFRQTLIGELLSEEEQDFNLSIFDMEEVPLEQALAEASAIPFFGNYRLVFIENPYFLTAEKKHTQFEHNLAALQKYLEAPVPSTILVFMAPYEKLDERKKIVKLLKKQSAVVEVAPMQEKDLTQYLQQHIQSAGYTITSDAFSLLLQLTDLDLSKAISELDKLFLYTAATKKISKTDVESLVPKTLEHNLFDLIGLIMQRKTEQALKLYHDLLLQGEEPIKLNALLISQFRLFVQTKLLLRLGYQQKNIADVLKIHPYRVKLAIQTVKTIPLTDLGEIFDELIENDYQMKTGKMDKNLLFELFLLKVPATLSK